jgi:hypothetical protein
MKKNSWVRLLTYITGLVNQELLLQNEYLTAENRILPVRLPARLRLSDLERTTLAEIGKRLGRKALDLHDKGLSRKTGEEQPVILNALVALQCLDLGTPALF